MRRGTAIVLPDTRDLRRGVRISPVIEPWMRRVTVADVVGAPDGQYRLWLNRIRRAHRGDLAFKMPSRRIRRDTRDVRWSHAVRERDQWRCRKCGKQYDPPGSVDRAPGETIGLEAAHVFGRVKHSVRLDVRNGLSLCRAEHQYFEEHPKEWEAFCRREIGDAVYEALRARAVGKP